MAAERRLLREVQEMAKNPPESCSAAPVGDDLYLWQACIQGPKDSPYHGGFFYLSMEFDKEYPFKAPEVTFKTKIYHVNVGDVGNICVDILGKNWSPSTTVAQVLLGLVVLMLKPNPDDPMRTGIAEEFKNNPKKYEETARRWTKEYANGNN